MWNNLIIQCCRKVNIIIINCCCKRRIERHSLEFLKRTLFILNWRQTKLNIALHGFNSRIKSRLRFDFRSIHTPLFSTFRVWSWIKSGRVLEWALTQLLNCSTVLLWQVGNSLGETFPYQTGPATRRRVPLLPLSARVRQEPSSALHWHRPNHHQPACRKFVKYNTINL